MIKLMDLPESSDPMSVCAAISQRAIDVWNRALDLISEADSELGARIAQDRCARTRDTGRRVPVLGGLADPPDAPVTLKEHPLSVADRVARTLAKSLALGGPAQTPAAIALVANELVDTVRITTHPGETVLPAPKAVFRLADVDVRVLSPVTRALVVDARNLANEFSERAVEERRAALKRADEILSTWSAAPEATLGEQAPTHTTAVELPNAAVIVRDDLLGSGGAADVYRGHDGLREVAVKVLRPIDGPVIPTLDHARVLANADHPNLAKVFQLTKVRDPKTHEVVDGIVMELITGPSLRECLEQRDCALALGSAGTVCTGILDAIQHLHALGLSHEDLHSDNVKVTAGIAKILDPCPRGASYPSTARRVHRSKIDMHQAGGLIIEVLEKVGVRQDAVAAFGRAVHCAKPSLETIKEALRTALLVGSQAEAAAVPAQAPSSSGGRVLAPEGRRHEHHLGPIIGVNEDRGGRVSSADSNLWLENIGDTPASNLSVTVLDQLLGRRGSLGLAPDHWIIKTGLHDDIIFAAAREQAPLVIRFADFNGRRFRIDIGVYRRDHGGKPHLFVSGCVTPRQEE